MEIEFLSLVERKRGTFVIMWRSQESRSLDQVIRIPLTWLLERIYPTSKGHFSGPEVESGKCANFEVDADMLISFIKY